MRKRLPTLLAAIMMLVTLPAWPQTAPTAATNSPSAVSSVPGPEAKTTRVLIPAGTVLHVRLQTTLTSKTSKEGDKFTAVVDKPVTVAGKEVVPEGSIASGHVTFAKPSGRIKGKAEMRIVLDEITTPENSSFATAGTLEDTSGGPCAKPGSDDEGTIKGCGKSKKDLAKDAALGSVMGAGIGATIGLGSEIDCSYFGNCGGPGMGSSTLYGAGLGAATALVYNLFKHEKQVVLVGGMHMTFVVNHSVSGDLPADTDSPTTESK